MSVLLVTYDLNKPGQDYTDLLKVIKRHSWAKLSESSYAVETDLTPHQLYSQLEPYLDSSDNPLCYHVDSSVLRQRSARR